MEPLGWVSLVTLGVRDVAAATRFYAKLGWENTGASQPSVSFLRGGTVILALWGREELAADAGLDPAPRGFAGVALAANVATREGVDAAMLEAQRAGGRIVKPAVDTFWGGRSGYFEDLDGHLWEVAWNPGFPRAADGRIQVPDE